VSRDSEGSHLLGSGLAPLNPWARKNGVTVLSPAFGRLVSCRRLDLVPLRVHPENLGIDVPFPSLDFLNLKSFVDHPQWFDARFVFHLLTTSLLAAWCR
jgi:hypothetical protein